MTSEIKEILEYIKEGKIFLNSNECKILLDYITNLQEENERLKEENKHIFANVNDDELLISNAMNYAEAQDYKSRINKANQLIEKQKKKMYKSRNKIAMYILINLEDILRGDE